MSNLFFLIAVIFLYPAPPEHTPVVSVQDVPLPNVCYDFNGEQTDATGNYDLIGSPIYTDGHVGQALSASVNVLQAVQGGELSTPHVTLSFWLQGFGDVNVAKFDSSNPPWGLSITNGNELYWRVSGNDDEMLLENALPNDNQWHHLIVWATGTELGVQIDGTTPITQTQNLAIPLDTANLIIGQLVNGGNVHLDMLKVWDSALTANERLADYNNGIGVSCEFLFTPTAVAISSFSVILPSGGRGEMVMGMTAGDQQVAGSLIVLLAVVTFDLVRRLVRSGSL